MKISLTLFLIAILAVFANAQEAVLIGTVRDAESSGIPNVKIKATDIRSNEVFKTVSDLKGNYKIELKQSEYDLEFHSEGFITSSIENYKISIEKIQLDIKLEIGRVTVSPLPDSDDKTKNTIQTILSGTIFDNQGFVVVGARILARSNGKVYTASSNEKGIYSIELPAGIYALEFAARGFKKFKVKKYQIVKASEKKMFYDAVLNPGNEVSDEKGFF